MTNNKAEISRLLGIGYQEANKVFSLALSKDMLELQDRILYTNKVRTKSAIDVAGINFNLLSKQIKSSVKTEPPPIVGIQPKKSP